MARLRAAAALIPAIEADLANSKLSAERAALMCEFCAWASSSATDGSEEAALLAQEINEGLERLRTRLG